MTAQPVALPVLGVCLLLAAASGAVLLTQLQLAEQTRVDLSALRAKATPAQAAQAAEPAATLAPLDLPPFKEVRSAASIITVKR